MAGNPDRTGVQYPDQRPSLRLRMAAVLLRDGDTPQQVAEKVRVPLALIELLAEEITTTEKDPTPKGAAALDAAALHAALDAEAEAQAEYVWGRVELARRVRRRAVLFRLGLVAIAVNLVVSVAADLGHQYVLGLVSVILAPALVLGLIWSLTRRPRRRPHRPAG